LETTRTIPTGTHGRYVVDIPEHSRATLVGFHGYQENAAITFDVLRQIAAGRAIGLISVQGLHRFYTRANDVVASWMTKEDREQAIADNVAYVSKVLSAVADDHGLTRPLIFAGFSQGVAMAYRAAALAQRPCDGVIALAGDLPPDVAPVAASLPRVLIGRGTGDKWYTADKAEKDRTVLQQSGVAVIEHVFDGEHAWAPEFVARAGTFVDELLLS
jgi:predicted esterase